MVKTLVAALRTFCMRLHHIHSGALHGTSETVHHRGQPPRSPRFARLARLAIIRKPPFPRNDHARSFWSRMCPIQSWESKRAQQPEHIIPRSQCLEKHHRFRPRMRKLLQDRRGEVRTRKVNPAYSEKCLLDRCSLKRAL